MIKNVLRVILAILIGSSLVGCESLSNDEPTTFVISFDVGQGSVVHPIEGEEGTSIELPVSSLDGYDFLGWTETNNGDAELVTEPFSPDSTMTLYAKWAINQYTISFITNGGSAMDPIIQDYQTTILQPDNPTKDGYSFDGWYTDSEFTTTYTFSTMPYADLILYAKWDLNSYTMSFITNDGSVIDPITQEYQTILTQPNDPIKDGYTFEGWYRDSALTTMYVFSTMPSEDFTLYAKWEALDWSDIEEYLSDLVPDDVSNNISLPTTYLDYSMSWTSNHPDIISNTGTYDRPYQATTVTLTATIHLDIHTTTRTYDIDVSGYKSLSAPLTSSYIYRNYSSVTDAFFTSLDIINCAFITADEFGSLSGTAVLSNINAYIMPKARENGNWVLFSVAPDSEWSAIVSSATRINNFADNIVAMINTYGFDGVDIDWETPTPDEAVKFTELMEVIYTKVKANNPNHLVTAAIAGGMWQPPRYDLVNSQQYLDYINMMTYGMVSNNGYYQNALSRSTVFANPTNLAGKTLTSCSIEESVDIYHTYGIPNGKIIVGAAFYGIKQTRTYNASTQTWSSWVNAGSVSYSYISEVYLVDNDYHYYYDNNAGVPYILSNDGTLFISYDNPRSIAEKSEYIIENGLAGMMYWEHGLDSTGTLLSAMEAGLK